MILRKFILFSLVLSFLSPDGSRAQSNENPEALPKVDVSKDTTLYTVGYSHLDTEWRWEYPTTVSSYVANTMRDNFRLFAKYPGYVFNFSGANRYRMMKEYYPADYKKVKEYVKAGRWFPCGSSMEENDALIPSSESIIRQILYGNKFFRDEFGKASSEYMLPDCFGFPASLPSILAHCGIKGFSTQKLTWGSAIGIPFNVGLWMGPDSESVIAVFNPGDYVTQVREDLSNSSKWLGRISDLGKQSGIVAEYMYYGTGDVGGAPDEESVNWIDKSISGRGPIRVLSAPADKYFNDISAVQASKLPTYKGELLLTFHSAGSLSSQAYMKRWNRKNELLAYSAEAASVIADWLGGAAYPRNKLGEAWRLVLGAQFHDIMAGTCTPKAYEYAWNDEILASNQFAGALTGAAGAVIRALDTRVKGIPLVVFNPLSIEREDVVEATVTLHKNSKSVRVFNQANKEVPSQILRTEGNKMDILFLARVPSLGFATYDVRPSDSPCRIATGLQISDSTVENVKYILKINSNGDVSSVFDKKAGREILAGPARLEFLHERPQEYPAWNMDWNDRKNPPTGYVEGPPAVKVRESGPVRAALEIIRESRGSRFIQSVRLAAGGGSGRVEFDTKVDWFTGESSLKAAFPLNVSNPNATYNSDIGTVVRGNNDPKKYEVPSHMWFDLTDKDGSYGVSVLEDCKYGSDKPSDNILRLTLLYTPGVRGGFKDQATQDFGKHEMLYALYGHKGDWRDGNSDWQAKRLNQPLIAFQTLPHKGFLGKSFSFLKINNLDVAITAIKKAENSDDIIVRLQEIKGRYAKGVKVEATSPIIKAQIVNGQEQILSDAVVKNGKLIFDIGTFHPLAFMLKFDYPSKKLTQPACQPVALPYNIDVISSDKTKADGSFDRSGASLPAELLPDSIVSEGIVFKVGHKNDGEKNAVACSGQSVSLPKGNFNRLYILAASADSVTKGIFKIDDKPYEININKWSGFIGQWDNRIWDGYEQKERDFAWDDIFYEGLLPGYVHNDNVAYFTNHRHLPSGENDPYRYAYLFKYRIDIPYGAQNLALPSNENIRILALTAVENDNDRTSAASILSDTLNGKKAEYERFQMCPRPRIYPDKYIIEEGIKDSIRIACRDSSAEIRYTLDGSNPTEHSLRYDEPIIIDSTTMIKAAAFKSGKQPSIIVVSSYYRAYTISNIRYMTNCSQKYPGTGGNTLIDSKHGTISFSNKAWQGFEKDDMKVMLDLGRIKSVHKVSIGCLSDNTSWIFLPVAIDIAVSENGKDFSDVTKNGYEPPKANEGTFIKDISLSFNPVEARYLKIIAKNIGTCPSWHPGAGGKAWLFVDEIMAE